MDCDGLRWIAMDCDGLRWIAMDCDGLRWIAMLIAWIAWIAMDGLQWIAMDYDGMRWNALEWLVDMLVELTPIRTPLHFDAPDPNHTRCACFNHTGARA